jgi:hypothetical protein
MKRHRADVVSLVFGLIFLGVALSWMFGWSFDWTFDVALPRAGWFLAAGLILLGILGLTRALRAGRNGPASEPDELT